MLEIYYLSYGFSRPLTHRSFRIEGVSLYYDNDNDIQYEDEDPSASTHYARTHTAKLCTCREIVDIFFFSL